MRDLDFRKPSLPFRRLDFTTKENLEVVSLHRIKEPIVKTRFSPTIAHIRLNGKECMM